MNHKLKKGDWIKCHDDEEIRQYLTELGKKGYGAVRSAGNYIIITREPEKKDEQS
jgi:hypothetical protein